MKKTILFSLIFLVCIVRLNAQNAPSIEWQKSLGGNHDDQATSIQQTTDGGFIVAGMSFSNNGNVSGHHGSLAYPDYWIVKLDSSGTIQWQKSLGGSSYDEAFSIQQTTDAGYIVAGWSYSNDGDVSGHHGSLTIPDYWIVKLDSSGTLQWQKDLGGSDWDTALSIQQTTDGGYIVAGYSGSNDGDVSGNHGGIFDYWVVKLDSSGTMQWQKCLGGSDYDIAYLIEQTTDSGYIVAGYSNSNDGDVSGNHGHDDFWIVKLSADIPLGYSSIVESEMFSVYPNPTCSTITITASFISQQSLEIKLTDIIGREVLSFDEGLVSGNFTTQYDLSALSTGTYFLKMIHDGICEMKKIEIEK